MSVTAGKNTLNQNERKKTMRKRMLMKRLSELEQANLDKTSEIAILRKEKTYLQNRNNDLKNQIMKLSLLKNDRKCERLEEEIKALFSDYSVLSDENDKLLEKVLSLQADKEGLIEYVKKLRCMHSCAEDEIKRLNEICLMQHNNIEANNVTIEENDSAYKEIYEYNLFLTGKVKAYEAALPKAEIVISEE